MTFTQLNLNPHIFKAINNCGYTVPTPIQARCIPNILSGNDVVASAQTGTGKTAAFILPVLHHLISTKKKGAQPRVLILTPTRELAVQITNAAEKYGKFLQFNVVSLVGGSGYRQQLQDLSQPIDIIVATPGRLLDHMGNRRLDLSRIEILILDEADRMLAMNFVDDVRNIAKATPNNRQTLLFSATVDDKLSHVIRNLLKNPVRIDLSQEKLAPSQIKQELYLADSAQHKISLLQHLLNNESIYKAIIFSATKINADKLAKELRNWGYSALALHGNLKQTVRYRTVEQFRRKIQFLVATDIAARGIDIADVSHVINYDLPKFSEDYIHRIGRTGRAGKTGIAISFALPSDAVHLRRIKQYTGQQFQLSTIAGLEPQKSLNANTMTKRKKHAKTRPKKYSRTRTKNTSKN
jgi:superfamily II DNA/RNA helicase